MQLCASSCWHNKTKTPESDLSVTLFLAVARTVLDEQPEKPTLLTPAVQIGNLIPSSQYMKNALHVGCGSLTLRQAPSYFHGPQWREIRYHIDPAVKPDVVGSMLDMSATGSASVDAVYFPHNLEHVFSHEINIILREFRRVLRPEVICVVTVPDIQTVSALIAQEKLVTH